MQPARQSWSDNGHVKVDWSRVRPGDVVDHVDVAPKVCEIRKGGPVWYVIVVQPNAEFATVERLHDASIRSYCPKVYRWVATKQLLANGQRKMEKHPRPMFPGYLLIDRRRGQDHFGTPLAVKGVRDYLWREAIDRHGNATREPCWIPDALYDAMLAREAEGEAAKKPKSQFKVGEQLRVIDGSFRDFLAEVEEIDDRGRVRVLIDIFARRTPVDLAATQLERA